MQYYEIRKKVSIGNERSHVFYKWRNESLTQCNAALFPVEQREPHVK